MSDGFVLCDLCHKAVPASQAHRRYSVVRGSVVACRDRDGCAERMAEDLARMVEARPLSVVAVLMMLTAVAAFAVGLVRGVL